MIRWARRLAIAVFALMALAGLAYWLADTEWGHRKIAEQIEARQPKSGLRIKVGRIEGSIYDHAVIRDLKLSDPRGVFLEAPNSQLDWQPLAWWNNRLHIDGLVAQRAILHRLPKLRPSGTTKSILPAFDIEIGRLEIGRIEIGKAVTGQPRIASVNGKAIVRAGRADIDLVATEQGGGLLHLKLDAEPDRDRFDVMAQVEAPGNSAIARILGTTRNLHGAINGDGSWRKWRGGTQLQLDGIEVADLNLSNTAGHFGLDGYFSVQTLTKGKVQRLTARLIKLKGDATLENRQLGGTLSARSDALDVHASGTLDLAGSAFRNLLVDATLLQPPALFPNMTGRNIHLRARLNGPIARAGFDYLLTADRVQFDKTGFEAVRASGQGRLSPAPVAVPVRLIARRVDGVGDVAGGILANLSVEGVLLVTSKAITGDGLRLRSDKLSGKLGLFIDLKTGRYDVGLAGQLERYLIPGLGLVDVKSKLKVVPGESGRGSQVTGRGQAWVRRFDNPFLASLAGGLPVLETGLARGPDGELRLIGLRLTAPQLSLSGNGVRRRDGTFYFEGGGKQGRYGPLQLKLDGRIERPRLEILLARPADALGLANVRLFLDPDAQGYQWRAEGGSTLGHFTGRGGLGLARGQDAVIDIASLKASQLEARGRLAVRNGGLSGRLALGGGGVSGTLDLSTQNSVQQIAAHVEARNARLEGPPLMLARRARFDGTIILDPGGTNIEGTVSGEGLARGGVTLARLAATMRMRNGSGEIRGAFAGSRGRAFDLQAIAQVSPGRWRVLGSGTIDRRPVALTTPAMISQEAGGWRLAPVEVSYAGGRAKLSGMFAGERTELDANLSALPLAVLDVIAPNLRLGGAASGSVSYRQSGGGRPSGKADLRIRGLTRSGLVLASQPIDMGISAAVSGGIAGIRAIGVSGGKEIGRAQARLQLTGQGNLFAQMANAPVYAQIRYSGSADALWRLSGVQTLDVSGPIALGADVSGRVSDPRIRGSLRTTNARIESPATGMVLTGVRASGRFGAGSQLILDSLEANAGKDGSVSGSGMIDLSSERGFAMSLSLDAKQALLISRDDLAAAVTGAIRISSNGSEGVISGDVLLNRSRFRLGRASAARSVPRLNVREVNAREMATVAARPNMPWRLDLKARAPSRLEVTGLGITSEWKADLEIGGTPFAPVLRGRADLLRGDYEFAGKRFDLARGSIRFQGENPPDPILDILAQGEAQGINATIRVTGTGQKPEIRFASVPSLPEDELLARLLFGTSITNLSAPEAVQLAAAVASLRDGGNGLNPINALRNAIGLDRLRILPADSVTGHRTAIAAGKFVTRRTYVELITDGQGYSATRAEFQVTRWLSLLSTISTVGRQSAALRISRDY